MVRFVIELQPPDHAMLFHVLGNFGFGNVKMFAKPCSNWRAFCWSAPSPPAANVPSLDQIADGHTQCAARLHVIERHQIGIRKHKYARTGGRLFRFAERMFRRRNQPTQQCFQLR